MISYAVTAPMGVTIHGGRVKLTADQLRRRKHAVVPVKGAEGIYEVQKPIMFKNGEEFGYEGQISKGQATQLVDAAAKAELAKKVEPAKGKK